MFGWCSLPEDLAVNQNAYSLRIFWKWEWLLVLLFTVLSYKYIQQQTALNKNEQLVGQNQTNPKKKLQRIFRRLLMLPFEVLLESLLMTFYLSPELKFSFWLWFACYLEINFVMRDVLLLRSMCWTFPVSSNKMTCYISQGSCGNADSPPWKLE